MGNYKFRLSDMIPNAWFYKLKDMSRTRNSHPSKKKQSSTSTGSQKPPLSQPRQSFYYTWESSTRVDQKLQNSPIYQKVSDVYFPDPPRRSSRRRTRRKTVYKPSPKRVTSFVPPDDCRCHASFAPSQDYFDSSTEASLEFDLLKSPSSAFESDAPESLNGLASRSSTCSCGFSSSATDIIIDVNEKSFTRNFDKFDAFDAIPELDLPPILTKPAKLNDPQKEEAANFCSSPQLEDIEALGSLSVKIVKEERTKTRKDSTTTSPASRRSVSHSTGIKLRANSPKLASKKIQGQGRKSISRRSKPQKKTFSESFAVVKASFDPQKDFRDSMMEMIVENNIRASKDLEELLACYLSLNSDEYHELIIKAFEQIWFNMPDLKL